METFAAVLTAVFFWAFLAYLTIGNRLDARGNAGQLLFKATNKSYFLLLGRIVFGFGVATSVLWAILYIENAQIGIPTPPSVLFLGSFVIPQLCLVAFLMIYNPQTEFRHHGLVTPRTGGPFSFVPWSRIRYCKWLSDNTLLVETDGFKMQIEVEPHQIGNMTTVLVDHAETIDPCGEIINADHLPFEYLDEPPPLRRHYLQFNLKTALLFMVVASSAFAWLGIHLRADWREQESIAALKQFDINVQYKNGRVDLLYFSSRSSDLSDDDLRHLASFGRLRTLNLTGTPITDGGLKHIEGLTGLTSLTIDSTRITDAGLVHIESMTGLTSLTIDSTEVTDACLVHMESLTRLESLHLCGTQVTAEGVQRLKKKLPDLDSCP